MNQFDELEPRLRRLEAEHEEPPDILSWCETISNHRLDLWQVSFLTQADSDVLFNCSRQVGKSEIVSLKAAYRVKYLHRNVAVLAPTLRQSSIIFRRARRWLWLDAQREGAEVPFARTTLSELEMPSGATFSALPGDRPDVAIRGDVIDDLIVDEASRIKDELIAAATPATATRQATITYLSTPAGKTGAFWRAWSTEDWWEKFSVKATECPRITPAFLSRERRRLGEQLFKQEYECEFLDTAGGMFSSLDLANLFSREHTYGLEQGISVPQREAIW
jgi:hypothetical protein